MLANIVAIQANDLYTYPDSSVSSDEDPLTEALSEELLNMPAITAATEDEDVMNTNEQTLATPHTHSSLTPASHEEDPLPGSNTGGLWYDMEQPTSEDDASPDINVDQESQELPFAFSHSNLLALSSLVPQMQPPGSGEFLLAEEDYYDYEMEHSVKNYECDAFFSHWKHWYAEKAPGYPPISHLANNLRKIQRPDKILAKHTDPKKPDPPDFQGIHWSRFQTTKEEAREVRRMTYNNHVNVIGDKEAIGYFLSNRGKFGSQQFKMKFSEKPIPAHDRFFDFRETNTKFRGYITHFQLRHNLYASSKNALFYIRRPRLGQGYGAYIDVHPFIEPHISCFNPETSVDERVVDFRPYMTRDPPGVFRPSTLNAANGVLTVGSFEGKYAMKSLSATFEAKPTMGVVTPGGQEGQDGSVNHIQGFLDRRSGLPQVAFSSNDENVHILDSTTNKFVNSHPFPYAVNSSAISPDGRLRLLVGDHCSPIVANADTGEEIVRLQGHRDYGFACDWAPDGVTMATGHQDGFVRVWDARNFSQCTCEISMEMAGSRTLQFSPLGTGKRVLIIAETGDFVHVVDAQTFESKQVIEFFGEIAGFSMPPDGSALYIANQDSKYGGLMEFERDWGSAENAFGTPKVKPLPGADEAQWEAMAKISSISDAASPQRGSNKRPAPAKRWLDKNSWKVHHDWLPDEDLDDDVRVRVSWAQRKWRGSGFGDLTV